jgi:uncharacterized protein YecE (DUF72 family)
MMAVRVGTSGYNYPEWRGSFYPSGFPTARMLAYYAERFDTVEINYSFYRMPSPKTVAGWVAETPAGFTFALKAPRRITHDARLRDVAEPLRYFLEVAQGLGPKLGPLLFQLPPTFRKDLDRLGEWLLLLPRDLRVALEVRHASWLGDDVYDALRRRNVALCIADSEERTTPVVATAGFGYLRLRDQAYADDALAAWSRTARRAEWPDAFVYFKHEESGTGPALAEALRGHLGV